MSDRKVGPDFHLVELTKDGRALANGSPLRISNGRISFVFPPTAEPVKVAKFEWDMLLRDHAYIDGCRIFSIVTQKAPPPAPAPEAKAATSAETKEK